MAYLILIKEECTRDAQVYIGEPNDPNKYDDDSLWPDFNNYFEIFLGFYMGDQPEDAIKQAAVEYGLPASSLRAVILPSVIDDPLLADAILQFDRYYEFDGCSEGDEDFKTNAARLMQDFHLTPAELDNNKGGILTKACELYIKFQDCNIAENDTWGHVIERLQYEHKMSRIKEGLNHATI